MDNLLKYQLFSNYQIYENNTIYNISNVRKEYQVTLEQLVLQPLFLTIQFLTAQQNNYLYELLRNCFHLLIEVYGNKDIEIDDMFLDPSSTFSVVSSPNISLRMRYSIQFIQFAILLNQQQLKLTKYPLDLVAKENSNLQMTLTSVPNGFQLNEFSKILMNVFTSSLSPLLPFSEEHKILNEPSAEEQAAAAAAAGKGGKGGKAAAPAAKGVAPAANLNLHPSLLPDGIHQQAADRQLTGRDGLFLMSTLMREILPANEYLNYENYLIYDVHLLMKKNFPVYESNCCLLKLLEILNISSASSITNTLNTLTVPVSSVSTTWKSVATPSDWYFANADTHFTQANSSSSATANELALKKKNKHNSKDSSHEFSVDRLSVELKGSSLHNGDHSGEDHHKYPLQNWNDTSGNVSIYGFYSHVALFFLLGDALKVNNPAPAAAAAAGGKKPELKPAATTKGSESLSEGGNSAKPILTKIVLSRNDISQIEKKLRKLHYELTYEKKEISFTASNSNEYLIYEYSKIMISLYCLLHYGYIPTSLHEYLKFIVSPEKLTESAEKKTIEWNEAGVIKVTLENINQYYSTLNDSTAGNQEEGAQEAQDNQPTVTKVQFALPMNPKIIQNCYQLFTIDSDQLNTVDNDLCSFIRYSLGHNTSFI
jgi:hypothetical protein